MFTIAPPPRCFSSGNAYFAQSQGAIRFTSRTRENSAGRLADKAVGEAVHPLEPERLRSVRLAQLFTTRPQTSQLRVLCGEPREVLSGCRLVGENLDFGAAAVACRPEGEVEQQL